RPTRVWFFQVNYRRRNIATKTLLTTAAALAVLATAAQAKMLREAAPIGLVGEPVIPRTVEVGFTPCPAEGCDFHYRRIPVVIVQNPDLDQAWLTPDLWMAAYQPMPYRQHGGELDWLVNSPVPLRIYPASYYAQAAVPNMPAVCPQPQ